MMLGVGRFNERDLWKTFQMKQVLLCVRVYTKVRLHRPVDSVRNGGACLHLRRRYS